MNGIKIGIYLVISILSIGIISKTTYDIQNKTINVTGNYQSQGYLDSLTSTYNDEIDTGSVESIEFSSDSNYLAVGISTVKKLILYEFNEEINCYESLSPPVITAGLGDVYSVDFSDDDRYLVVGDTTSPYVHMYDVLDDFDVINDPDLDTDGTVYDAKFYGDYFLVVGGNITNGLKMFRYEFGDFQEWNGISEFPSGVVRDIEYNKGYLFVVTDTSPYLYVYKEDGSILDLLDITFSNPTSATYSVDTSDNGNYVVVGTSASPYVNIYEFDNETLTPVGLDTIPTQTSITYAVKFIDNNFLYVGGDLAIYKYKLGTTEFELQANDLTSYTGTVKVIDTTRTLDRIAVGTTNEYDCYFTTTNLVFDPITLEFEPSEVNEVSQLGVSKDYVLLDKNMYVIDELYDVDVYIDYDYIEENPNIVISVLPILSVIGALMLLVLGLGGKK